jgi:hypothetical protein
MPRFEDVDMSAALTEAEVAAGQVPPQPVIFRQTSGSVTLTTNWQRLDLATQNVNSFPGTSPAKTVDWDATNKLFTFNAATTRNYIATLNARVQMSGITLAPLATPIYVQYRFVVPNGVSPGVDFFFPFSTTDGFLDLQEVPYNSTMRHQRLTPITADASKRANGVGCEMRINANPLTGSVSVTHFSLYMFGS